MKVLISGGGTGGHIFPALAIAGELRRRHPDIDILFVGAEGRMEMKRVPAAGYEIIGLPVAGFDRKRLWRNFGVLLKLRRSLRLARKILRDFRPDIAVGVGGYASGPMLKAAQRAGIPTLLQEQNSYAGVTNKLLAAKAKSICVAYEGMERFFPAESIRLTGNPIRSEVLSTAFSPAQAREELGFDAQKPLMLVVGGSLGAGTINQAVSQMLAEGKLPNGVQLLWQTGERYIDQNLPVAEKYPDVKGVPFITRMDLAYRAADLVVARAGACTISELQLLGKAALLIPSPNVAEDHQRRNAEALVSHDAAVMLLDNEAVARLGDTISTLMTDTARLEAIGRNVKDMALENSVEKIADQIEEIINGK